MASRAHVHDYYSDPTDRPRRAVRYPGRDEPVVLPRDRSASANVVLIASGVVATAIIAGGAYAIYAGVPPPPMGETPTPALVSNYQLDDEPMKANVFVALVGPRQAVPSVEATSEPAEETEAPPPDAYPVPAPVRATPTPLPAAPAPMPATPATPAPSEPEAPQPTVYPDPITTPPDAIAPPGTTPETPQPLLDPENPYR